MPPRRAKTKPVEATGGGEINPRKKWNTGAAFIPPAPVRPIDAPAPRKKANNRRLPSAKQIKTMVPKKGKASQKKLALPEVEEAPTQLDDPEDGYWDEASGGWIDTSRKSAEKKGEKGEAEEDELESEEDSPPALFPSRSQASVEETSSRLAPPIHGHKVNATQRAINRATTSSTADATPAERQRRRPLSPNSIRLLHELDEEDEDDEGHSEPRRPNNAQPLFDPYDSDESLDMLDVEAAVPPSTSDSHGIPSSRSTVSVKRPSRVPDSVVHSSVGHGASADRGPPDIRQRPREHEQEADDGEDDNHSFEDKENITAATTTTQSPSKRRKVITYSKRIPYAYVNPAPERVPFSQPHQPGPSEPEADPLDSPPSRNPDLSKERSMSRDYERDEAEMDYDMDEPQRSERQHLARRARPIPSYTDDDGEDEEREQYRVRIALDDPNDPDWHEEFAAMGMFATDSLESRDYHSPQHMIPVTAAFPANRYVFPHGGPRLQHQGRPRRKAKPPYIPLFEDDDQARLLFTQSSVEIGFGPARNHPRNHHIPTYRPKRVPLPPQQRHYTPGHVPRPLNMVPAREVRERYMHEEHRIPVDPLLLKYAAQKTPRRRWPQFRDEYRHPAEPRIVHPSDVVSEPMASFTSTVPPYYPTSRLALRRKGKLVPPPPRLQFTAMDPPSQPRLPTTPTTNTPAHTRSRITDSAHAPVNAKNISALTTSFDVAPTLNPHPIHPLSFNRSGTSAHTTPKDKTKAPFIPQNPRTPQMLARQPSQPAFMPYIPMDEPTEHRHPSQHIQDADGEEGEQEDEMVPLDLGDGQVVMISRRELDDINNVDLDHLSEPSRRSRNTNRQTNVDEIEEFDPNEAAAPLPTPKTPARARSVFGDITAAVTGAGGAGGPTPGERMSGIDITEHLLNLASRVADNQQRPRDAHQRRLAERRERLEAQRRAGGVASTAAPASTTTPARGPQSEPVRPPITPASIARTRSTRPPAAAFATPAPPRDASQPPPVHPKPIRTKSIPPRSEQPLPLQAGLYPAKSAPPFPYVDHEPPKTPRKRAQSMANSQYKPPTRLDATPPPEPTTANLVLARLAKSFPAYASALTGPPPPRPPPPPRLGVGPVGAPAPLKSALKRTRTTV